jgi:hypothetical protein
MSPHQAARLAKALVAERAQTHGTAIPPPSDSRSRAGIRLACVGLAAAVLDVARTVRAQAPVAPSASRPAGRLRPPDAPKFAAQVPPPKETEGRSRS